MRKLLASALLACVGACLAAVPAAAQSTTVVKQDRQFHTQGSFSAYASPWSADIIKSLRHRIDYEDTITIDTAKFPATTTIRTRWPTVLPSTGVWGYHHLAFGNYDGGRVQKPIAPKQVAGIQKLQVNWSFSYSGSTNFNLLSEFYLTTRPGDAAAKVIEIGIFPHVPPPTRLYVLSLPALGYYTDSQGRNWRMTRASRFVMLTPTNFRDITTGSFDFLHLLRNLQAKKVVTGYEWFNGLGFGVEPTRWAGSSTVKVDKFAVDYD